MLRYAACTRVTPLSFALMWPSASRMFAIPRFFAFAIPTHGLDPPPLPVWLVDVAPAAGGAEPEQRVIVCDESGEDPSCHNSVCHLGMCTSVADHLTYMGAHMWAGDEC